MARPEPEPGRRNALTRRVRLLTVTAITYNVAEAVVAIGAGMVASSTVLTRQLAPGWSWPVGGSAAEKSLRWFALLVAVAAYTAIRAATAWGEVPAEHTPAAIVPGHAPALG